MRGIGVFEGLAVEIAKEFDFGVEIFGGREIIGVVRVLRHSVSF